MRLETTKTDRRHVDYAIHSDNVRIEHREAVEGIADHSCVFCDTPGLLVEEVNRKMTEHEVLQLSQQEWSSRQQQCSEAVKKRDVEKAWEVLRKAAEATLTQGEGVTGRHALQHSVIEMKKATKLNRQGAVLGRTMWTAVRQAQALRSDPLQPHLLKRKRKVCSRAKRRHPAPAHLDPAGASAVREAGQNQHRVDEQKRVDMWTLNLEADLIKVRRWVKQADAADEAKDQLPRSAVERSTSFVPHWEKMGPKGRNIADQGARRTHGRPWHAGTAAAGRHHDFGG